MSIVPLNLERFNALAEHYNDITEEAKRTRKDPDSDVYCAAILYEQAAMLAGLLALMAEDAQRWEVESCWEGTVEFARDEARECWKGKRS